MKYYSNETNGFYDSEINGDDIPQDAVEITDDNWMELLNGQSEGKIISADDNGYPVLIAPPQLTHEEHIEIAERKKQNLIAEVTQETEMLRTKLTLKRIKPDEEVLLIAWLDYLDLLEAVDTSTAPDIIWPEKPE